MRRAAVAHTDLDFAIMHVIEVYRGFNVPRMTLAALFIAALAGLAPTQGRAQQVRPAMPEVDTEHLFGVTEGSDIGRAKEIEIEIDPSFRLEKRTGAYAANSTSIAVKYGVTDALRIAPTISFSRHRIGDVPGLANLNDVSFESVAVDTRVRLLNWRTAPFGLTLSFEPSYARIDPLSGRAADQYSFAMTALVDKALIPNALFGAINVGYLPTWSRNEATNAFKLGGALSVPVAPGWFLAAEARYERLYDGIGLSTFVGESLFVGPSALVQLSKSTLLTIAWNAQVSGHAAGDPRALDLVNFERQIVFARLAVSLD